ncbi:MAG: LapA family protein [Succinivibrio sp.]|jgi:uncharacterized membrane protein YciS (DUF1049 family)|nr:LapA family protein [Succinivibrio sp.]
MLRVWAYVALLVVLVAVGLAIGSANDAAVSFDYLFGKADMPVSSVLVIGIIFGVILGMYLCLLLCFKLWRGGRSLRGDVKSLRRQLEELKSKSGGAEDVSAEDPKS